MVLVVNVVCARNIPGESLDKSDSFAKLRYGDELHSIRADSAGGANPNFNQAMKFAERDPPGVLEVAVYDSDVGFDDFLAKAVIEMSQVLPKLLMVKPQPLRSFYPLTTKGGAQHGEIELEFLAEKE